MNTMMFHRLAQSIHVRLLTSTFIVLLVLPAKANEIAELKKQIADLARKIELLEQQRNHETITLTETPSSESENNTVISGDIPGSFKLPGTDTSIKIGGFVQSTVIYDIGPRPTSRGGDIASARTAILEGNPGYENRGDTRLSSRNSRFNIATFTPTRLGRMRTFIEGDFNGPPNNKASRASTSRTALGIRHAYGELGNLLAGQYWSNFSDNSVFPSKVDGSGPVGRTFIRQGQLRYTYRNEYGGRLAIALENPYGDFYRADDDNLHDGYPDLTAHYRHETDRWHLQFSGLLRRIGIHEGTVNGAKDNVTAWGINQSGAFLLPGSKNRISWYLILGDGVGRYMEGGVNQAAAVTTEGKLDTQFGYGGFVTYRHWWTDTLSSNLDFGYSAFDLSPDETGEANRKLYSSHINLMWSPLEQTDFGIEYVWAHRKVHDGREGKINRVNAYSVFYF